MMRVAGLVAGCILLVAGPAAAASLPEAHVELTFEDVGIMKIKVVTTTADPASTTMRSLMDGDDDGHVSEAEVAAYEEASLNRSRGIPLSSPVGLIWLDGRPPETNDLTEVRIEDATGSTDEPATVKATWSLTLGFEVGEGPDHLLEIDPGNHSRWGRIQATAQSVVLRLPQGFVVNQTGGLPFGASVVDGGDRVDFPHGLSRDDGAVKIQFVAEPPARSIPGVPGALAIGALSALAWTRWRQRQTGRN